jgi:hypothetical protein
MKRNLFLSLLFLFTTTFASIHETKHIGHEHDSASCDVCVVSANFLSGALDVAVVDVEVVHFEAIDALEIIQIPHAMKVANHSRAPPFFS